MTDESVVRLLRELVRISRIQVYPVAKAMLRDVFFDNGEPRQEHVRIYANLDGATQRDVAERAGVTQPTVSRWSNDWKRQGLVDENGVAVFDIYDFFPELKE